jgi:hypothetical protein
MDVHKRRGLSLHANTMFKFPHEEMIGIMGCTGISSSRLNGWYAPGTFGGV